jgi:hypothetical protein
MQTPIYRASAPVRKTFQLNPAQWLTILLVLTAGFVITGALLGGGITAPAQPDAAVQPVIERQHPAQLATPVSGTAGTKATVTTTPGATSQPAAPSPTPVVIGAAGAESWNKSGL